MTQPVLLVVTTVPETLNTILRYQPRFLAQALTDALEVRIATSPGPGFRDVQDDEGLPVHPVAMARGMAPFRDILSILAMIRLLLRLRPAIVHSYTAKAGLVCMVAAWLCRVPVRIHTFTGLVFPSSAGLRRRILMAVDRLICACATRIVPEGLGVKTDLQRHAITRKYLAPIGHGNIAGVDTHQFARGQASVTAAARGLATRFRIPERAMVFCFAGRLNRDKGIGELLQAFEVLPENCHLLIVGGLDTTAPINHDEQSLIAKHPRIHATGFMQDIRPALQLANILVLPSYREGFPNIVLQAGAMSLPVIASDISGCNEVIKPGLNGWLIQPRSTSGLHAAMLAACHCPPATLAEMGARARLIVQSHFERSMHWRNMQAFYYAALPSQHLIEAPIGVSAEAAVPASLTRRPPASRLPSA